MRLMCSLTCDILQPVAVFLYLAPNLMHICPQSFCILLVLIHYLGKDAFDDASTPAV